MYSFAALLNVVSLSVVSIRGALVFSPVMDACWAGPGCASNVKMTSSGNASRASPLQNPHRRESRNAEDSLRKE
jgi:hypothetical protein